MKTLALTTLALLIVGATQMDFSVNPSSKMWIDGTSSVHDWTCDVATVEGTLAAVSLEELLVGGIESASIAVPMDAVDCHKGVMNKKVRKALKVKEYPTIDFDLVSASSASENVVAAAGVLTIAGAEQDVQIEAQVEQFNDRAILSGTIPIKMSDFNIDPPTALLGTLKTGDSVNVRFELVINPTSTL